MTLVEWIGAAVLDFGASLAAFIVWTHLDAEGWWEQRRIEKGRKLDDRPGPPPPNPYKQG